MLDRSSAASAIHRSSTSSSRTPRTVPGTAGSVVDVPGAGLAAPLPWPNAPPTAAARAPGASRARARHPAHSAGTGETAGRRRAGRACVACRDRPARGVVQRVPRRQRAEPLARVCRRRTGQRRAGCAAAPRAAGRNAAAALSTRPSARPQRCGSTPRPTGRCRTMSHSPPLPLVCGPLASVRRRRRSTGCSVTARR